MNKDFIQELRANGIVTTETNTKFNSFQYRGLSYLKNINKGIRPIKLEYKEKIGFTLKFKIKELLTKRGLRILMQANAGGGKTYSIMECASELAKENPDVVYILAVPNTSQSDQNEVSEDLKQFGFTSIVGKKNGKRISVDKDKQLFSCVYDRVLETIDILKKNGKEVVLIIDEAHKLIWDTYRHKALEELENAIRNSDSGADMVIMMTATPRTCKKYYQFDEIYELIDTDIKNNIRKLRPVYTRSWAITLIKEINRIIDMDLIPLVRLNSKDEIKNLMDLLENAGIKAEMLTSNNKDSEIFKSIEETGMVGKTAQVIFCTSVVECGISLKATDIVPIEVIRRASDFNRDNSTQFFARPRKAVQEGIIIIKQYDINLNPDKKSVLELHDYDWYFNSISQEVQYQYNSMKLQLERNLKTKGYEYAKRQLEVEIAVLKNHPLTINVIEADYDNVNIYIDNKKVIQRVFAEMDKDIVVKSPLQLRKCFKGLIFYDNEIKIEVDEVYTDINDLIRNGIEPKLSESEADKKFLKTLNKRNVKPYLTDIVFDIYDEKVDMKAVEELKTHHLYDFLVKHTQPLNSLNNLKRLRGERNDVKKLQLQDYRELLKDENFVKIIPLIESKELNADNIKDYNLDVSLHNIIDFRETSLFKQLIDTAKVFNMKEAITLINHKYKNNKGEEVYISRANVQDVCELKYFIEKDKHIVGLTKYDLIYKILINKKIRTDKNGKNKLVQINLTDDLMTEIATELVRNEFYNNKPLTKVIKEIEFDMFIAGNESKDAFYSKENIKKLDLAMSSQIKNKVWKDINKIFRVGEDSKGYPAVNAPVKKFNLIEYIKENY